jgi:2-polyprenyl-6-methoxyphenol hydroxylase-like FAD-dependent oxidoreductase
MERSRSSQVRSGVEHAGGKDMSDTAITGKVSGGAQYDAVIVGASLAGSAAAIMLGRAGARVALVEQRPEASAFKRVCSHYIQSSAVASLERLGLLEPMLRAGAVRSRGRIRTPWGWIEPSAKSRVPSGVNLRREVLDPLVRETAAHTPGVDLIMGHTVHELMRDGEAVCGALARNRDGQELRLRARLLIGADGRDSRVAKLAGVRTKTYANGRFAYGGYFEGPPPAGAPDASLWFMDPDMAAAFPTDAGLTFYACMPTKERLSAFRGDPAKALAAFVSRVPDAPPILASRLVGQLQGKLDMTNVAHAPTAPGVALVGDAALAVDPLWGVGCGWALQSSEWLADCVAPALLGEEPLRRGLARYRRRHTRALRGHAMMIYDYATGRKFSPVERLLFSGAARDERLAGVMEAFGTRNIGPLRMMAAGLPLAALAAARRATSADDRATPALASVSAADGSSASEGAR